MIRRIYQSRQSLPYSLHDSRICGMELNGDTLLLKFETGFMKKGSIIEQVDGNIEITKLDLDFCNVYLMEYSDVLCGNEGHFKGEKTSLVKFIGRTDIYMDVMEETYGDNQLKLSGYLSTKDSCQECLIVLYYSGDVWYQVYKKDTGMAKIILSADNDRSLYSVPAEVAGQIEDFCMEFGRWMHNSPHAGRYREQFEENGMLYTCVRYNEADFIEYLNCYAFPDQPSVLLEWVCKFDDEIPQKYEGIPSFNF